MPELPEVEHLRRTLEPRLLGARVVGVELRRVDVVKNAKRGRKRATPQAAVGLLNGARIEKLVRHGKQMAIVAEDGRVMCVHLGMTGQMVFKPRGEELDRADHVHCVWNIRNNGQSGRLLLRDPRRFGGLWTFPSIDELREKRWAELGPDALTIDGDTLRQQLAEARCAIKAALLDQARIAGVGNIYADESLFEAKIHPLARPATLPRRVYEPLAAAIRGVMDEALSKGGSTLRDYFDANGEPGRYAAEHRVYGRDGQDCRRCGALLRRIVVAQRSTVFCPDCQNRSGARADRHRAQSSS